MVAINSASASTTTESRSYAALSVLGLSSSAFLASLLLGSNAGLTLKALSLVGGVAALASAVGIHRDQQLVGSDYRGGVDALIESARDHAFTADERDQVIEKLIKIEALPDAIKSELSTAIQTKVNDFSWTDDLTRLSRLIFAKTGGGKTYWLVNEVARLDLTEYFRKGGYLAICDRDYGKEGNNWGGLPQWTEVNPQGIIFTELVNCYEQIIKAADELERRNQINKSNPSQTWQPYTLYVDEFASLIDDFNTDDELITALSVSGSKAKDPKSAAINALKKILIRGRGYNVKVVLISQGASVGMMGLNTEEKAQLNMLALNPKTKFAIKDLANGIEADQLLAECERYRSMGLRPAVLGTSDQVRVVVIPELSMPRFDLSAVQRDPVHVWIDKNRGLIAQCKADQLSLTAAWERVNKPMVRQSSDNPYYQKFKEMMRCV